MNFIVIDDDPINNHICRRYTSVAFPQATVEAFTDPQKGVDYILTEVKGNAPDGPIILLLDINMPVLSGWDVLDIFEKDFPDISNYMKIYILSSSVSARDQDKARRNVLISGFIEKPISVERLKGLAS